MRPNWMTRAGHVLRIVPKALLLSDEVGAWKLVLLNRLKNSARNSSWCDSCWPLTQSVGEIRRHLGGCKMTIRTVVEIVIVVIVIYFAVRFFMKRG